MEVDSYGKEDVDIEEKKLFSKTRSSCEGKFITALKCIFII